MAGNICPKCGKPMTVTTHNGMTVMECVCGYLFNASTGKEYSGFDMSKGQIQANCPQCGKLLNFPAESSVISGSCPYCDYDFMIDTDRGQIWQKVNCPKCGEINSLPPDAMIGEYTCRKCSTPVALRNQQPNYRNKVFHVCPGCGAVMTTAPSDKMLDIRCHVCSTQWRFDGKSGDSAVMGACSRCGHTSFIPMLGRYHPYICENCGKETRMANPPIMPEERRWLHVVENSDITREYLNRIQAHLARADIRAQLEQGRILGFELDFDMRYLKLKPVLAGGTVSEENVLFEGLTFAQVKREVQQARWQMNLPQQQMNERMALDFDAIPFILVGLRFAEVLMRAIAKDGAFEADFADFKLKYTGPKQAARPQAQSRPNAQPQHNTARPAMTDDERMWINKVEQSQITKVYGSKLEYLFGQPEFRRVFAKGNIMGYELRVLRTFMLLVPYFTFDTSAHDEQAMYLDYPFGTCAKELRAEAEETPMPPALMQKFFEHEYTAIPYESACDRFAEIMFREHLSKFDYLDLDFKNRMIYTRDCPPKVRVQKAKTGYNAPPPKQKTDEEEWIEQVEHSRVIEAIGGAVVGFYNDEGIKDILRRENVNRLQLVVSASGIIVQPFCADGKRTDGARLAYTFAQFKQDIRQNMLQEGASKEMMRYYDAKEIDGIPYQSAKERAADILIDRYLTKIGYLTVNKAMRYATVNLGAANYQQNTYQAPPQYAQQPKTDEQKWIEKVENSSVIEALGDMAINYFNDERIKNIIRQENIVKLDLDCGPEGCQVMAICANGSTTDVLNLYADYSYKQMRKLILDKKAKNGATPQQLVQFEKNEIERIPWHAAQMRVLDILIADYFAKVDYLIVDPKAYTAAVNLNRMGPANAYQAPKQTYQAPPQQNTYQAPPQYQAPQYQASEQKKGFFSNMFSSIKQGIDNNKAAEEQECAMVEDNNTTFLAQMQFISLLTSETSRELYADSRFKGFYVKGTRYGYEMKIVQNDGTFARDPITARFEKIKENNREEWGDQFVDSCFTELYYASSRKKFVECLLSRVSETPYWNADPKTGFITKK